MNTHTVARKSISCGILTLIVLLNVSSSLGNIIPSIDEKQMKTVSIPLNMKGNTFYVGGSGPGNYTYIQEAIDAAHDGDTVYVFKGTYYENIIINKELRVTGEEKKGTIIDGQFLSHVVHSTHNDVFLSGFTMQNSGDNDHAGLYIQANNNTISNIITIHNIFGVLISGTLNILSDCYAYNRPFAQL